VTLLDHRPGVAGPTSEIDLAAHTLRRLADLATEGPWDRSPSLGKEIIAEHCARVGRADSLADAAYVAAMHPGVALALAAWLNHIVSTQMTPGGPGGPGGPDGAGPDGSDVLDALAVARAVNAAVT
jgi:hypothetical protein